MVSLLNSQGIKSCKSRQSFYHNILTIYTNHWSTFCHAYWCHVFSSVKFLNMCKPRADWSASTGILWQWASKPTEMAEVGECRLTWFHWIRNFLANEIYHFSRLFHQTGCLFTWAACSI